MNDKTLLMMNKIILCININDVLYHFLCINAITYNILIITPEHPMKNHA